jgi:hypothetical protein
MHDRMGVLPGTLDILAAAMARSHAATQQEV